MPHSAACCGSNVERSIPNVEDMVTDVLLVGLTRDTLHEQARQIEPVVGVLVAADDLLWLDLAALWRHHTGLPWVAAVWAVRPVALKLAGVTPQQLAQDLTASRDAGLAHIETLVREWTPRIAVPPDTIRTYFTRNIHYTLDPNCLRAIECFRTLASQLGCLPSLPQLNLLEVRVADEVQRS